MKDERSRQFLSERDSKKWLGRDDVAWVFQNNDDQTQVIKRYVAASGARWWCMMIRRGTAVTLAHHGCKQVVHCVRHLQAAHGPADDRSSSSARLLAIARREMVSGVGGVGKEEPGDLPLLAVAQQW